MGLVFGRLFAVAAVVAGSVGCERRHPVIGLAFGGEGPGVADLVHATYDPRSAVEPRVVTSTGMIVEDGAPGQITMAARFSTMPEIVGVVGHADSRGTLVAAPVYHEARIPLLVPTATSRRLRTISPWVFMMAPDDSVEAEFIAAFAADSLRARAVAVFYDNDEYGIGLRDGLRTASAARGLRPIAEEAIVAPCGDSQTAEASIERATPRRGAPDLVVIAGRTRAAACISRRVTMRIPGVRIIGADGVEPDSAFFDYIGPGPVVYIVAFWHPGAPGAASAQFARDFHRIVGRSPRPSEAMVFDAITLLVHAAREVGTRPDAVRRYLTDLGRGRPAYDGVTGAVAFAVAPRRPLYMLRVSPP